MSRIRFWINVLLKKNEGELLDESPPVYCLIKIWLGGTWVFIYSDKNVPFYKAKRLYFKVDYNIIIIAMVVINTKVLEGRLSSARRL